ncbi:MAG: TPM domain-containing protein [Bacteroidales bacterium]
MLANLKKTIRAAAFFFVLGMMLVSSAHTLALPQRPSPPRLVNDKENLLSPSQRQMLEQKLVQYDNAHSTQIAIVITNNLHGYEISDFAVRLAEHWGVGSAGSENGVMIAVAPAERKVFIAVGYGLEGVIPDITAKRIVDNEILPAFRNGDYYQGLDTATQVLMQLAAGEFAASDYNGAAETVPPGALIFPFLMIVVIVLLLSRKRNAFNSPGKAIPAGTLFWLLTHGSRGSKGSFGSFSSGRGGFSGGGGSFRGFGGGRFGGGGAGGSW